MKTILVTGAYGHAGSKIINGLLEKTPFKILATGRKIDELQKLKKTHPTDQLTIQVVDVENEQEMLKAFQVADLLINASGPYSMIGFEIVKAAVKAKLPYIDLANEQLQLKRLRDYRSEIEAADTMVFTCTGQSPGVSTLLMKHMADLVDNVDSVYMFGVIGRLPTPDKGLGSMMGGILEASLESMIYVEGKHEVEPFGSNIIDHSFPEPFGTMNMLSVPIADAFLIPEVVKCKTVMTMFGLDMDLPPGIDSILKFLKPHRRKWAYKLLEALMKKSLKDSYKMGLKEGFNPGGYMKVVVQGDQAIEAQIKVEDNSVMTSYLPIVIALNYFENPDKFKGLLTPTDAYTFESFNEELAKLNWKIPLNVVQCTQPVKS